MRMTARPPPTTHHPPSTHARTHARTHAHAHAHTHKHGKTGVRPNRRHGGSGGAAVAPSGERGAGGRGVGRGDTRRYSNLSVWGLGFGV